MGALEKGSIESPDEVRPFRAHGHSDVVSLPGFTIGRSTYEPGWRWSEDVRPIVGGDLCQVRHTGMFLQGQMTVKSDDGSTLTYGAGDVFVIEPGHDAWVEGDEECVLLDTGIAPYAKATT